MKAAKERVTIKNVEILFDMLTDVVDEINEVFSKEVSVQD